VSFESSEFRNRRLVFSPSFLPLSHLFLVSLSLSSSRTIIHAAVCSEPKNIDAVKALLSRAPIASLSTADEELWTPLHSAASSGRSPAAVALLLSLLSSPSAKDGGAAAAAASAADPRTSGKRTPLHYAASKGHAEIVRVLLAAGADPAAADGTGERPLHRAAGGAGSLDVLRSLLAAAAAAAAAAGAKPAIDARDRWGRTALMAAAAAGRRGAALLLVARGASLEVTDGEGRTALEVATAEGGTAEAGKHLARQMQSLASGEVTEEDVLGDLG